jgi:CheY-like chemotaxis protein
MILSSLALTKAAIAAACANTGLAALQKAATENHPYDIVLIDMQMPVIDGLTLGSQIKANSAISNIPFKGSSGNVGATAMRKIAEELEQLSRKQSFVGAYELVLGLVDFINKIQAFLIRAC